MTEIEQRRIFARNLNRQLEINGKTQKEVAEAIHVLPTTFNTWCTGTALPRMGKVQLLAEYFNIKKSDLIDDKETDAQHGTPTRRPLPLRRSSLKTQICVR